jgi:hypothetical protein
MEQIVGIAIVFLYSVCLLAIVDVIRRQLNN